MSDIMRDDMMMDLFRQEAEAQTAVLNKDLLILERQPTSAAELEACMRAAHSLKGAARIIGLDEGVKIAHVMEDCLVAAQEGKLLLTAEHIDALLAGSDILLHITDPQVWSKIDPLILRLEQLLQTPAETPRLEPALVETNIDDIASSLLLEATTPLLAPEPIINISENRSADMGERVLRVTAEHLNQLLDLSSKSLVELKRVKPVVDAFERLRRQQRQTTKKLVSALEVLKEQAQTMDVERQLEQILEQFNEYQTQLQKHMQSLDDFNWQATRRAQQLYDTALMCRMRPFADVMLGQSRMVRDLGRSLGKQVRLEVEGDTTQVDRDVLKRLEAPLIHLLRNAVDHGLETPEERMLAAKPIEGRITVRAYHHADKLRVDVEDDGRGIDLANLRELIVKRQLTNQQTAHQLTEPELLSFLFLPSFSMRQTVTEVSGRGVGLDAVHHEMHELRGSVSLTQQSGLGTRFTLEMPLTLSIIRSLLVEISGEVYAFPLGHIERMLSVPCQEIVQLNGRQHIWYQSLAVSLISASQLLQRSDTANERDDLSIVLLRQQETLYGITVDKLLGEQTLVVLPLDTRLGKIQDVLAGAVLENGTPVLILDVEDMLRSTEKLIQSGSLQRVDRGIQQQQTLLRKRVLVVDDSLTVRELEKKLLLSRGYDVSVAVDGMEGWNMLRAENFDLVVTDIDMPRMNGIELVTLIRRDSRLQQLPVMVVSYKDREEDRMRGLDAGADYYLAKASFHDEALLDAVVDLIGEART
ncbi:hybrid sensor histidine kinase/response regulator [Agitococcus lubricus]|uniref:Chemotaxis protein CheA n=1 Tax=Agitococcus lubricus TaxID=1077255 RepID=A0A2T5IVF5_9GAMM|nr:hybrid sensor histidine kinase/response regulator [Agitococcus lubricus]PTQ87880.1 two-component system sensor histidine kinase and response regulator WspE [Agitococcus lubricus]